MEEWPATGTRLLRRLVAVGRSATQTLRRRLLAATTPPAAPLVAGALADMARSKPALIAEHAFLRQQRIVLRRGATRPRCTPADRALLVLLAKGVPSRRRAPPLVRPDTPLRWHRRLFRRSWRRRSRAAAPAHRPALAPETVAPIREMATANRTWGAERIRGEPPKLDLRVAKSTIRHYLRQARPPHGSRPTRATFLRHHAPELWAGDFLQATDLLFRPLFASFIVEHGSRRVVHVGVTRHPADAWAARQLREATPFGRRPRDLVRDNDSTYGPAFSRVAAATGIEEVRPAHRTPLENATCERFLGSVRRECLDHVLVPGEAHLRRVLCEYAHYFNRDRPHQGLAQRVPEAPESGAARPASGGGVRALPILGGLHHAYARAA